MRRIVLSFGLAALLLGGFLYLLDPVRLAAQLSEADPVVFGVGLLAIVLALACWGEATRRLFGFTGADLTRRRAFIAYGTGAFGKQVLPMGNAGGPAVMAYAFNREVGLGYSRSLAVVVVAEFISLLASIVLAVVGIVVLITTGAPANTVRWLGIGVAVIVAGLAVLTLLVWYRREGVTAALASGAGLLQPIVALAAPSFAARLEPSRVVGGLERYYETVEEVLADRSAVLSAAVLTQLGWVLFAVPLYSSALALDVQLPVALVLFLVPAAGLATAFPLPGGLGGLEVALAALLVALLTIDLTQAGAVVVLYRLCSFWFFVLVAGLCASLATASVPELVDDLETPVATLEAESKSEELTE